MTTVLSEVQLADIPVQSFDPPLYRMTADQYHALIDAGFFAADDRFELIEGIIVRKMAKNPPHATAQSYLERWLGQMIPSGWLVRGQNPIALGWTEPEPDVVVARGTIEDYDGRHPDQEAVGLLIEIADSSLEHDRGWKRQVYAKAGIAVYWIVNLRDRQIEVYQDALEGLYSEPTVYAATMRVPLMLDGMTIADVQVEALLPKPD
ncbi:MAG: Uma2 family endonuclease [Chloroflexota bacterium]|nr:Uma2 family endonuclease [Chloroflexota bacterium]